MTIDDFINEKGRTISSKTKEKFVMLNFPEEYEKIRKTAESLQIQERTFSEKMYHFFNSRSSPIVCKNCKKNVTKFRGLVKGYLEYCSSKCSNSNKDVMLKKEKTYFSKYGVKNPSQSVEILNKIQNTFNKKYGGNPAGDPLIKAKSAETCLKKYNDTHPFGKKSTLRIEINKKNEEKFREKHKDLNIVSYTDEKWGICTINCDKCGKDYEISKWNLHQRNKRGFHSSCTFCNPIGSMITSSLESKIINFLDSLGITHKRDRKTINPYEIDLFLPDKKLGIEINGIYWHSSTHKPKSYHLNKTELALLKGVRLIHIFEDEIVLKEEIVKSRISSMLGIYKNKIFARKCEIKTISPNQSNSFLEENHLQGRCGALIRLGLFYKEELVSVMTFSKDRKSLGRTAVRESWELVRFCNKKDTLVIGGASKLFKHFTEKYSPGKITSFCDRRWSPLNSFYSKLGFIFKGNTSPNYWYFSPGSYQKYHRFSFRKNVLVEQGFDPRKTEFEIMAERKFMRVYDCGNSKWEWVKE